MSVWVALLSFSVSMTWGFVRVLGCVGVWLNDYEPDRWGVCSEDTQPHPPLGWNDYVS